MSDNDRPSLQDQSEPVGSDIELTADARTPTSKRTWLVFSLIAVLVVLAVAFMLTRQSDGSKSPVNLGGPESQQTTTTVDPLKVAAADAEKASRVTDEMYFRLTAAPVTNLKESRDAMAKYMIDPELNQAFQAFQVMAVNRERIEGATENHYTVLKATPTEVQFEICQSSHLTTIKADGTRIPDDDAYYAFLERVVWIDNQWKVAQDGPKGGGRGDRCTPTS